MTTFGNELRRLLAARGWTLGELARRSNYDKGYLSKVMNGHKPASMQLARRLDEILGAAGTLMALVNRRAVLRGAAALAGMPLLGALDPAEQERLAWTRRHPPRIDTAVVRFLADVLAVQRRAEDAIGPRAVMTPVLTQLAEIEELVRQARGPVRPALVEVAQQWAQYGAYLYRDAGNSRGDRALLSQALEWASEIGDQTMTATVLVQRGNMELAAGEIGAAIGFAQAAQRDKTVAVGQRADGADLEARGYALAGDTAAAERKLGDAAHFAAQLEGQDLRPWLYWMSPQYFECQQGVSFSLLADDPHFANRAIMALEDGYSRLPDDQRSSAWAARNLAHLADVYVRAGNAEQALASALQGAEVARLTGSARLRGMLAQVHGRLTIRWPQQPAVAELGEALR